MRPTVSLVSRAALAATALTLLAACATVGGRAPREARSAPTTSRQSYVIDGASLPSERPLMDVVAAQWPRLLSGDLPRGNAGESMSSMDRFAVYDTRGAFLGGPDYLRSVRANDVRELRRLTSLEEAAKFGHRHPAGAVVLVWRTDR